VAEILVDVPCSATGTVNKRPDVLRKDGDLGNLLDTQEILANHCADNILQSGGVMVDATCSLLARESEDQVHKLLTRGAMKTLPFAEGEIPGFDDAIDANGWLRVLP
jgi:16S rRNA (cytosine967-C5)-methyltransferase